MKHRLLDVARVVRSKNSGPFELTLDILFQDRESFEMFRRKNIITKRRIAALYRAQESDVLKIIYFEPSWAVKVTLRRWLPSGSPGDTDIYGAQQHAPLLDITW